MKCLNQRCLLNKNKKCDNDIVLKNIAPCFGKDRVQAKTKKRDTNVNILFADRRM
jgi:hypothetical protein